MTKSTGKSTKTGGKSKRAQKGSIGFVTGGVMSPSNMRVVKSELTEPSDVYDELVTHYGPSIRIKYLNVENPDDHWDAFLSKLETPVGEGCDLYKASIATATKALKDAVDDEKAKCHTYPQVERKKAKKDGSDEESEAESEEEEEVKPKAKGAKADSKKAKAKKEESEAESDEEEEPKPKAKAAKADPKAKGKASKKVESEEEDAADSEEEEKPKLKKKADPKAKGKKAKKAESEDED
jgi:hypothetical protein